MNQETNWQPLAGYEGLYMINDNGAVRSVSGKRTNIKGKLYTVKGGSIKVFIDRGGYPTVKLTKNLKCGTQYLHRLLALTFIPNPDGKCCVNHKNGNKLDYSLSNLEWATYRENYLHAVNSGLQTAAHPYSTRVIDMCSGREFESIRRAAEYYDIEYYKCQQMLHGYKPNYTCLKIAG